MQQEILSRTKELVNLGVAEFNKKNYSRAITYYKKALELQPNLVITLSNIGSAYNQLKQYEQAEIYLRKAIKIEKNNVHTNFNIGHSFYGLKEYKKAIKYFEKVILLNPYYQDAYLLLGISYAENSDYQSAINVYDKGLTLFPNNFDYINNLAKIYHDMGDYELAISMYKTIIKQNPKPIYGYTNIASVYFQLHQYDIVIKYLNKALKIEPKNFDALMLLADVYNFQHRYADAISLYKTASRIKPNDPTPIAGLYDQYRNLCEWEKARKLEQLEIFKNEMSSFTLLQAGDDPQAELQASMRESTKHQTRAITIFPRRVNNTGSKRKIRVGLFSADFKDHPVGHLMQGYFDNYNTRDFEVFVYSFGQNDGSIYRQTAESKSNLFYDMFSWSDIQIAERIYDDSIDILIDLMGYTQHSRPNILAMKPAPIQIQYLGYPATSGASYIDYLIADKTVVPPKMQRHYSEKILYLPGSFMPIDSTAQANFAKYSREDFNLPNDVFIYSSFCGASKIDTQSYRLWMEILKGVDNSILWLRDTDYVVKENLKRAASQMGVRPSRIFFSKRVKDKNDHLSRLVLTDLALDTLIYGGHTTTVDFLLANVPVVTKMGSHFAGRVAASILTAAGMEECITENEITYKSMAIALGKDKATLTKLKNKLSNNRKRAEFFKVKNYVSNLEKVLITSLGATTN